MDFMTTITQKGQVTLPKHVRTQLNLSVLDRVIVRVENDTVVIKPSTSIMKLAGFLPPKPGKDTLKARDEMEKTYERI